ncbi:hypothetical protein J6590_012020 [Homalodisca vitripennis]|nr:hypothetical protein J6590_012020 [Homalodisca vitripennis]
MEGSRESTALPQPGACQASDVTRGLSVDSKLLPSVLREKRTKKALLGTKPYTRHVRFPTRASSTFSYLVPAFVHVLSHISTAPAKAVSSSVQLKYLPTRRGARSITQLWLELVTNYSRVFGNGLHHSHPLTNNSFFRPVPRFLTSLPRSNISPPAFLTYFFCFSSTRPNRFTPSRRMRVTEEISLDCFFFVNETRTIGVLSFVFPFGGTPIVSPVVIDCRKVHAAETRTQIYERSKPSQNGGATINSSSASPPVKTDH